MSFSASEKISEEIALLEFDGTHNEKLEKKYLALWESLEFQNIPKGEIARKGHELIEQQLKKIHKDKGLDVKNIRFNNDSWYYELAARNNFTPKSSESPATDNTNGSPILKLNEESDFYSERYDNIILIQKMRKFLSMCEYELEKDYDEIKVDDKITFVKREWKDFYDKDRLEFHDFLSNLFANYFDEWSRQLSIKQSLLPKMWILSQAIMGAGVGISDFCSNYFAVVKNKTGISTKAWRKFISEVNNYSDYMHFIQDDAWKWSVLPIPCPQCKKNTLRTRIYKNGTWEFVCTNKKAHKDEVQPHFTPALFLKTLDRYIKNTGKISDQFVKAAQIEIKSNERVRN